MTNISTPAPTGCTAACLAQVIAEAASYTDDDVAVSLVAATEPGSISAAAAVGALLCSAPTARPVLRSALLTWVTGHPKEPHDPVLACGVVVSRESIVAQTHLLRDMYGSTGSSYATVLDEWLELKTLWESGAYSPAGCGVPA